MMYHPLVKEKPRPSPGWIRKAVYARDGYRCRYCGVMTSYRARNKPYSRTADHLIPRSKGGRTNIINLVTCCKKCNDAKKSHSLSEMGYRLRPTPTHTHEQIERWKQKHWPDRCVNCNKAAKRHGRPPYHGGPRECQVGNTLYMATSHYDHLLANKAQTA